MKLTIKTEILQSALAHISKIGFRTRVVQDIYRGVQFIFKDSSLFLYAYNGVEACEYVCGVVDVNENFSRTFDFNLINKIISNSSAEFIEFDFKDTEATIKDKKSFYDVSYMNQDTLSYIFEGFTPQLKPTVICGVKVFEDSLFFVNPCMPSATGEMSYLSGVYFDGNAVTTDRVSIAVYPIMPILKQPLFIALESFKIMAKVSSKLESSIYVIDDKIVFCVENAKYLLRLMSNSFPNYKSVAKSLELLSQAVTVKTEDMISSCKKLVSLGVKFGLITFSKEKIVMKAGSEAARGEETVDINSSTLTDKDIELKIPFEKLLACLSHSKNKEITFMFDDTSKQYIIKDGAAIYINSILKK